MSYLLDTNACIALLNGRPESVTSRFERVVGGQHAIAIPALVAFELWYGAAKSARRAFNTARLEDFFAGALPVLGFDQADAKAAGEVRAALERRGTPIGTYDVLIAGMAIARELTLVTANVREFARVARLRWEDWAQS